MICAKRPQALAGAFVAVGCAKSARPTSYTFLNPFYGAFVRWATASFAKDGCHD